MTIGTIDWRAFVRSPWAVLAIWLAYCLVRLAIQPLLGWEPVGPDDWTRLLQVRAWLDGQGFWDVTQYRMNPPEGFSMHWSRLVDLPLAALMLLFGETAAMALVPLVWLLPALFALRAIMLRLDFAPLAIGFGLVILPLFPMLPGNFAPMRIDHHAPQAVLALVCAALLIRNSRWSALACGLCAAAWLVDLAGGLATRGGARGAIRRALLVWRAHPAALVPRRAGGSFGGAVPRHARTCCRAVLRRAAARPHTDFRGCGDHFRGDSTAAVARPRCRVASLRWRRWRSSACNWPALCLAPARPTPWQS